MTGTDNCTKDTCDVSQSIYGYAPNLGGSIFFLIAFFVLFVAHIVQGLKWKTKSFLGAMAIGAIGESIGYGGRIMLHYDPFTDPGFKLQIVCLTLSPAFLAAGIYFTLKYLILIFGESFSLIRAKYYTWIFISCDLMSIALQGAGGGISAAAVTDSDLKTGNNLMIAGVAFQVATLTIFAVLALQYAYMAYKNKHALNPETFELRHSRKFQLTIGAIALSLITLLIRCAYRVAEMAGGWGNPIMQKEGEFFGLDAVMVLVSILVFNIYHPGFILHDFLPKLPGKHTSGHSSDQEKGDALDV
ncbi:MAG: hypothetical protein M1824_002590 [Vezdaea acicularis]|nr:MAG: hypothetical protein M1824_002590 [Vezdaea acicularis]